MFTVVRSLLVAALPVLASVTPSLAQQAPPTETKEAAYTRAITERADKIVVTLGTLPADKATKVRDLIAGQYRQLSEVHEARKAQLAALKTKPQDEKTATEAKQVEGKTTVALDKLHNKYLRQLGHQLTPAQVEQVKNGMTYNVLPITMAAYEDMLPTLTADQKTQMLAWLTEAREHAMDAGTSQEKHAWFGKYKGRINNYLSAAGIDMNQAGKDWQARLAARKAESAAH